MFSLIACGSSDDKEPQSEDVTIKCSPEKIEAVAQASQYVEDSGFVWILVDSMPMFLIMQVNLNDIYSIWYVVAVIAVGVLAVSLTKGILHYKVKQVV